MKALIVDDDRVLADVVAFTLRREGFEVLLAHDGASGLRRWQEEQPDLVVLDVNMPKMDGFEVCRKIREQADTPILLLTVRGDEDDIVAGLELVLGLDADAVSLTPLESRLLECLLLNAGQVLTFDTIIDQVWGPGGADRDMLRQLVRRLRAKIEPVPAKPIYIQTVPGLGYGFVK
jgi:DNA-binding response OmpR family regulator